MPKRKTPTIPADTTTFVIQDPKGHDAEDPVEYRCTLCPDPVLSTESDSHAVNVHGSAVVRVFASERGLTLYTLDQEVSA